MCLKRGKNKSCIDIKMRLVWVFVNLYFIRCSKLAPCEGMMWEHLCNSYHSAISLLNTLKISSGIIHDSILILVLKIRFSLDAWIVHNGNNPFKCTHCDKSFVSRAYLMKYQIFNIYTLVKGHLPLDNKALLKCCPFSANSFQGNSLFFNMQLLF